MIEERTLADRIADVLIYLIAAILGIACMLPFLNVIAESLSSAEATNVGLVSLWPIGFNIDNFGLLTRDNQFVSSFGIAVLRVVVAVPLTLLMSAITAYPMSRDNLQMPGRTFYKMVLIFGMLFSGGLVPTFMAYKWMGLLNKFSVLILPGAFNIFYTILIINFFRGIPHELHESAVLDGARHFDILFRIYLPISIPSLATVAVFTAVGNWNSWFDGVMFLNKPNLWPLQSYLYQRVMQPPSQLLAGRQQTEMAREALSFAEASAEGMRAAMIVIASIPIMLVYPFLQRYFVKGLTLGAVKG